METKVTARSLKVVGSEGSVDVSPPIQISRRGFLKAAGAASAAGLAGCANDPQQKILPYVKPDAEQIPGVAVWYRSTCTECSAGCGIQVRTREGRAVKIEGNPDSPVNRGGLCALGQASIQHLYDPDRIREPLARKARGATGVEWEKISWADALKQISESAGAATGRKILLTGSGATSHLDISDAFSSALGFDHVSYDPLDQVAVAKASELTYGTYGIPTYRLAKAEVLLNFGSDFMETWVNPCGFMKEWSEGRRAEKALRFVHIEPRLSLTGANADLWLSAKPGTERSMVLWLCKTLLAQGKGANVRADVRNKIDDAAKALTTSSVAAETGVSAEKLLLVADYLARAGSSVVMAGGTAASGSDSLGLHVAVNLLNMVLGNVGKTVEISAVRRPRTSLSAVKAAVEDMRSGKVDLLFVFGANPAFTLPANLGFSYAANAVRITSDKKKAGLVVAFSSHMDETTELADIVLPVHTALEDWGYVLPADGVVGLMQPAMSPIFETKGFGDLLMEIAAGQSKPLAGADVKNFEGYVKAQYLKLSGTSGGTPDRIWLEALERGGVFDKAVDGDRSKVTVNPEAFNLTSAAHHDSHGHDDDKTLTVFPFPSVKTFDGRAANRPWLQELADPVTQLVWDTWAEIHPETAKRFGLAAGDVVTLRNANGEVNAPVYITEHVHPAIVALPIGQGHTSYGRFAKTVGDGNVYSLLDGNPGDYDGLSLLGAKATVSRGRGRASLVNVQGSDDQMGREIARTKFIDETPAHHGSDHGHDGHGGHHEPKQMYFQREHPLYQWGMAIDLAACTGCSACVVACYAENNIPVVGKSVCDQGREMSWLRIERYFDGVEREDGGEELKVSFVPMLCQHCQNAPCEPVCPVYATYHNEEGMNAMVYNRCVGTRYCSNNCSYKVRRFNWFQYEWPELLDWQLNPDVTKRTVGVMEKCTFCVQRIQEAKNRAKDLGRTIEDGEIQPACVQTCPADALAFGNLKDPNSKVSKWARDERGYKVLDHHLNTQPSITYLEDIRYKA